MRMLLPVVAALVPLILLPGFSFHFDVVPKVVLLLLGAVLSLIAWNRAWPRRGSPGWWIAMLLAAQCAWLALATALSTNPALSLNGGNWRRFGLVTEAALLAWIFLVMADADGRVERVEQYLRALALTSIPIALYGVAQYFGWDPWLAAASYHAGEEPYTIVRPPGTLGHAAYFGTYLIYPVFAGYALAASSATRLWRAVGFAASVCSAAGLVLSGTRAAMLGLIAGAAVLALRSPALRTRRHSALAGAALLALAAVYLSPAGTGLRRRMHWSLEEPAGGARPRLWLDSLRMSGHRIATGYGPETFGAEFPRHQSAALARAFPEFQHESPHNILLDVLVSEGIPGLLLFAALPAFAIRLALAIPAAPVPAALLAALAGGLCAQQLNAFTLPAALVLYLMIALLAASAGSAPWKPAPRWARLPAIALAAIFALYAGRLAIADRELALAAASLDRGDLRLALSHYQTSLDWHPAGSGNDLYFSRQLANFFRKSQDIRLKLGSWTPAFQAAARATLTAEDRQNAFYNLAIFFATQNDAASVERSLRSAIALAPNWYKPHWTLAKLLMTEGRLSEARQEAELAVDLDGGKDQEVRRTLDDLGAKR